MSDKLAEEQKAARLAEPEPPKPLKFYTYYFVHPQQVLELFKITATEDPTQEMVENVFAAALQQNGPGLPAPTHVIVSDLVPLGFEVKRPRITPAGLVVAR